MIITTKPLSDLKRDPETLTKEIEILYELGLEEYEVRYLVHLKTKREVSLKWQD